MRRYGAAAPLPIETALLVALAAAALTLCARPSRAARQATPKIPRMPTIAEGAPELQRPGGAGEGRGVGARSAKAKRRGRGDDRPPQWVRDAVRAQEDPPYGRGGRADTSLWKRDQASQAQRGKKKPSGKKPSPLQEPEDSLRDSPELQFVRQFDHSPGGADRPPTSPHSRPPTPDPSEPRYKDLQPPLTEEVVDAAARWLSKLSLPQRLECTSLGGIARLAAEYIPERLKELCDEFVDKKFVHTDENPREIDLVELGNNATLEHWFSLRSLAGDSWMLRAWCGFEPVELVPKFLKERQMGVQLAKVKGAEAAENLAMQKACDDGEL